MPGRIASAARPTAGLAATFLAVLLAMVVLAPTTAPAHAQERTVTYRVISQGSVLADVGQFAAVARDALTDPRGWSLGGTLAFHQVSGASDFDLILASPAVVANASPGCSAQWSCRVGRNVYINDERWRSGTQAWPHGLDLYQRYVILHEVGHWLGMGHTDCLAPGRTASVMQQQSISLQGCRANVWPVIAEREQVGRRLGVSVAWSGVEQRYRALGQDRSLLGGPVTWETVAPDRNGRFQHYSGSWGASIYWHPWTGAHEVYGAIRQRWAQSGWELGPLNYPVTGERGTPDGVGRFNHFSGSGGGSIYWHPWTGAHEVYGAIRQRWAQSGWELGPLGYPVSGEYEVQGGRRTDFQRGSITWDRVSGATQLTLTG